MQITFPDFRFFWNRLNSNICSATFNWEQTHPSQRQGWLVCCGSIMNSPWILIYSVSLSISLYQCLILNKAACCCSFFLVLEHDANSIKFPYYHCTGLAKSFVLLSWKQYFHITKVFWWYFLSSASGNDSGIFDIWIIFHVPFLWKNLSLFSNFSCSLSIATARRFLWTVL